MKKILSVVFCLIILCGGSGLSLSSQMIQTLPQNSPRSTRDATHTVFLEYGTTMGCYYCQFAHGALQNLYAQGDLPFSYVSLVAWNVHADERLDEYHVTGYPTVIFDGGYRRVVGAGSIPSAEQRYAENMSVCAEREVADLWTQLSVVWIGNATMDVSVRVQSNESSPYSGRLRVYVTEISCTRGWADESGDPYTFAFLDYAFNENIWISAGDTWEDSVRWDGYEHSDGHYSFGDIMPDNIMVFAAVFGSDFVDDSTSATPEPVSAPPSVPFITGPDSGVAGVEYPFTFTSIDPEGNDVFYYIDWGDGTFGRWIGPFESGETATMSHRWNSVGAYTVMARAKDISDSPSGWSDPHPVTIEDSFLEIGEIRGGFAVVKTEVKNNRTDLLNDVTWNITVKGGLLGLVNSQSSGIIYTFPAGETRSIQNNKPLFGLGKVTIIVTVETAVPPIFITKSVEGKLFGPFVRIL